MTEAISSPRALEEAAQEVEVVEGRRDDGLGDGLRDASTPGQADRVVAVAEALHRRSA